MKKVLSTLLCCLLLAAMVFSLVACPAADPTPGPNPGPGGNDDPPVGPGGNDDPPTPPTPVVDPVYNNGGDIAATGAAITDRTFLDGILGLAADFNPESGSTSGTDFASAVRSESLGEYQPYVVNGLATVSGVNDATLSGHSAQIAAPDGLKFENCDGLTLTNFFIKGTLYLSGCTNVTISACFFKNPDGAALVMDETCSNVKVTNTLVQGKTAVQNAGDNLLLTQSIVQFTETGLLDTAAVGTTVYMTEMSGTGTAISATGREVYIRRNTISSDADTGVGVKLSGPNDFTMSNNFVAENVIKDAKYGVVADGQRNTSVVLNTMKSVKVTNGHSVYVCSNALGGRLEADTVDYLLADENTYPVDELDHTAVQKAVTNRNGDTVTDVDARVEYGADEALLPHVDKDLFVGAALKDTVKDYAYAKSYNINQYVSTIAGQDGDCRLVIAPGKYAANGAFTVSGTKSSNTYVYAYGAYAEKQSGLGNMITVNACDNVQFRGLIVAFKQQSCGQVYVLDKLGNCTLLVTTGAGMMNEFGTTNPNFYNTSGMGAHHEGNGEFYAWCDTSFTSLTKQGDGTMKMVVGTSLYNNTKAGDVFTCRSSGSSTTGVITGAGGVVFRDVTMYGNSGGFAFVEQNNLTATTYYRLYNTTRYGELISDDVYAKYEAWEDQYGVDLQISIDEQGRKRGSLPHIGSIDATHTTRCAQGSVAKFCIFENMCDDATNQNHTCSRLHGYKINAADNTVTLTYKPSLSEYSFYYYGGSQYVKPGGMCYDFKVGDRVYIYTSSGQLICDGPALSATKQTGTTQVGAYDWAGHTSTDTINLYQVTVSLDDFNENGLKTEAIHVTSVANTRDTVTNPGKYVDHLTDNRWIDTYKVLVDNMSMASNGFIFENCLSQNIRSRGLLIKASQGVIDHCTFKNIGMACAAILYEIYWGESGVTEDMKVTNNLFDHTGYFRNQDRYSPISVEGLGSQVDDDYLLYKDIVVEHNKILNRTTTYAFFINSAKRVTIKDNWVGMMAGEEEEVKGGATAYSKIAHIIGAKDIEFSGNYFETYEKGYYDDICALIEGKNYMHVFGSDVEEDGETLIPDYFE